MRKPATNINHHIVSVPDGIHHYILIVCVVPTYGILLHAHGQAAGGDLVDRDEEEG